MKPSLRSFGLRSKVLGVFLLILVANGLGGWFTLSSLARLEAAREEQLAISHALSALKDMQGMFVDANLLGMDIIVDHYENSSAKVARRQEYTDLKSLFESSTAGIVGELTQVGKKQDIETITSNFTKMLGGVSDLINAIDTGVRDPAKYEEFDKTIDGSKDASVQMINSLKKDLDAHFAESIAATQKRYTALTNAVWTSILASAALFLFIGFPLIHRVSKSLTKIQQRVASLADVSEKTSTELSEASRSLASYSTQSSAAIQQSVSALTEMSAMLSETTRNAADTAALSTNVLAQSKSGLSVMVEMSSSMNDISGSSTRLKEIVKIIENIGAKTNVINDVVFKTQLLAVNASIEAARAGHHGKGFAVVANEVASLASLSGRASTEIKDLLSASANHVSEIIDGTSEAIRKGEKTSEKSTAVFEAISQSVETIAEKIQQMSVASKEQELGVSQTSAALSQLNQATNSTNQLAQKNAGLGEEIMAVSEKIRMIDRAVRLVVIGSEEAQVVQSSSLSAVERILQGGEEGNGSRSIEVGVSAPVTSRSVGALKTGKLGLAKALIDKNVKLKKSA